MSPSDHHARKLLLVSYWYPPGVGAAAERMRSFARYLPEHGWEIQVLTAARPGAMPSDRGVVIHAVTDPLARASLGFADYDPRRKPSRWKTWLRNWSFPDRFVAWRRAAVIEARKIIDQEPISLVLASFPPASVVDVAARLRESGGPPVVLDFRDRWLGPGGYEPTNERVRRRHLDLERRSIRAATAIITVSEAMADSLATEQGFTRERIFVIPNGYEEVGRPTAQTRIISGGALTIAHVGTVIARNRPDLFFQSVVELHRSRRLANTAFEFVGNLSRDYLQSMGLADVIRATGLVSRDEARRKMAGAQALLLLTGQYVGRWGYNAKIFEYIRSGRPILCLEERAGSNDGKLLVKYASERSFLAPLGDAAALRAAIEKIHSFSTKSPAENPGPSAFDIYNRKNLAARLADHLRTLVC